MFCVCVILRRRLISGGHKLRNYRMDNELYRRMVDPHVGGQRNDTRLTIALGSRRRLLLLTLRSQMKHRSAKQTDTTDEMLLAELRRDCSGTLTQATAKTHYSSRRVEEVWGTRTQPDYTEAMDKLTRWKGEYAVEGRGWWPPPKRSDQYDSHEHTRRNEMCICVRRAADADAWECSQIVAILYEYSYESYECVCFQPNRTNECVAISKASGLLMYSWRRNDGQPVCVLTLSLRFRVYGRGVCMYSYACMAMCVWKRVNVLDSSFLPSVHHHSHHRRWERRMREGCWGRGAAWSLRLTTHSGVFYNSR